MGRDEQMSNTIPRMTPRRPRDSEPMKPHMIRCTDEEWAAISELAEDNGEWVSEMTRRLWAEALAAKRRSV